MENKKATRVIGVRKIENQDVYNMEVEDHHNFSVEGGLIVHNCMDRNRYALFSHFGTYVVPYTEVIDDQDYDYHIE